MPTSTESSEFITSHVFNVGDNQCSLLPPSHRKQCFKSAWMFEVLHSGFRFPTNYPSLKTAQLVYDKEVQWTLGAILFKTRFLPLRCEEHDTQMFLQFSQC